MTHPFRCRKVAITRAVFLGLLHRATQDRNFFVKVHADKEFADGTFFTITSMEKVCVAVLRAWSLLNTNPREVEKQLHSILDMFRARRYSGIVEESLVTKKSSWSSSSDAWANLKQSIKDAQILPLELIALRMMNSNSNPLPDAMVPFLKDVEALKRKKRMDSDWYTHKHWFMSHMVDYHHDHNSNNNNNNKVLRIRSYKDWAVFVDKRYLDQSEVEEKDNNNDDEDRNNDVANDRAEDVCRKQYYYHRKKSSSSSSTDPRKLTSGEKKLKAKAGPFHPAVMDAANRAIEEACRFDFDI